MGEGLSNVIQNLQDTRKQEYGEQRINWIELIKYAIEGNQPLREKGKEIFEQSQNLLNEAKKKNTDT